MGRAHEKWHICKCLVFHAENLLKVYTQKNSGYTKSRRKIRQQKIPKIDSKFLHIELLSREAWASKDTRFLTLSGKALHYLLEQWCYLLRYLEDGRLEISNNRAERSIKPFVMGRKTGCSPTRRLAHVPAQ